MPARKTTDIWQRYRWEISNLAVGNSWQVLTSEQNNVESKGSWVDFTRATNPSLKHQMHGACMPSLYAKAFVGSSVKVAHMRNMHETPLLFWCCSYQGNCCKRYKSVVVQTTAMHGSEKRHITATSLPVTSAPEWMKPYNVGIVGATEKQRAST